MCLHFKKIFFHKFLLVSVSFKLVSFWHIIVSPYLFKADRLFGYALKLRFLQRKVCGTMCGNYQLISRQMIEKRPLSLSFVILVSKHTHKYTPCFQALKSFQRTHERQRQVNNSYETDVLNSILVYSFIVKTMIFQRNNKKIEAYYFPRTIYIKIHIINRNLIRTQQRTVV